VVNFRFLARLRTALRRFKTLAVVVLLRHSHGEDEEDDWKDEESVSG